MTFTETGLPKGTNWSTYLNGYLQWTTGTSLNFTQINGSFYFLVEGGGGYTPDPSSGYVDVAGAAVVQPIVFSLSVAEFDVTFTETGLPAETMWWVNLTLPLSLGSGETTVSTSLANGSYPYTVASANKEYSAEGGSISVDGFAIDQSVVFSPVNYSVAFTEAPLPTGTVWWVNLSNGESMHATTGGEGDTITFSEQNGSYTFVVASANKTYSAPGGSLSVSGAPVEKAVSFALVEFTVTFTETGLPSTTEWWINVTVYGGPIPSQSATGTTIEESLANASYSYTAVSANKTFSASGGSVLVDGKNLEITVSFGTSNGSPAKLFLGLPGLEGYGVLGGIGGLAIILLFLLAWRRRKKKDGASGAPPPNAGGAPPPP